MAFTVPNAADAVTYPQQARLDSRDLDIINGAEMRTGVLTGGVVSAQGTPNMTVAVTKATVRIGGDPTTVAAGNSGTFTAANATNPRIDLLTVDTLGALQIVTGTAAATPVMPTIPANRVVLARIDIPANATSITAGQIVDKRIMMNDGTALLYPEDFGALGDARRVNDATITSGAATITSATAAFTSGDTGKTFVMVGAGASGAPLTGTVTFVSATTVTASVNASTTVAATTGGELWIGTDDTAAIQKALNACTYGQLVYINPAKAYIRTTRLASCTLTAGSTTVTGTFTASDVGRSISAESGTASNTRWCSYIVSQTGTACVVATAPPANGGAAVIGLISVINDGSGICGQGTLVADNQNWHSLQVIGCVDPTVTDVTLRAASSARQTNRDSAGILVWNTKRLTMRNTTVDGAGSAGVYMALSSGFVVDDHTSLNSRADGFHMTNMCTEGMVRRPTMRYVGDDGIAVVSYTFDLGICSDIKIYGAKCLGETGGRGATVVGGNDISFYDTYVERSSAAGIYVASEDTASLQTLGCRNIRFIGARTVNANTAAGADHGSVMVYNGMGASGYVLENIQFEAVTIIDSRRTASANVIINTNSTANTLKRLTYSQFDIQGGQNLTFYAGGAPDAGTQVNRIAWLVDGVMQTDVIVFNTATISPQVFSDSVSPWRKLSAVYGGLNEGQQPAVSSGEFLTPKHTTRGTLAMAAANNWVWFVRVDVTRKGGQSFASAGVNPTVAQSGGTTNTRVGLYADDGTGTRPTGAAVYDWGAVAVLTGTVAVDKVATITSTTVPPGIWWLAFGYQESVAPTTRATLVTATGGFQLPNTTLSAAVPGHAWHQAGYAGAALPTVGTLVRDTNPVLVGLKA